MSLEEQKMIDLREVLIKEYPESPVDTWELKRYWEIINLLDRRVCYMGQEGCKNPGGTWSSCELRRI